MPEKLLCMKCQVCSLTECNIWRENNLIDQCVLAVAGQEEKINRLEAEAKMGNIPYKEAIAMKARIAELERDYNTLYLEKVAGQTPSEMVNKKEVSVEFEEVYEPINLITSDGERMSLCMRDSGYEFKYQGEWYEAKNGVVKKMARVYGGSEGK